MSVNEKYEFIDAEKAENTKRNQPGLTVVKMCELLEVSQSGFYDWKNRTPSETAKRRKRMERLVQLAFDESDETYGYRRLHAELERWGEKCCPLYVRDIMLDLGLVPCQPRPYRHCLTDVHGKDYKIPDLVARDFTADAPGVKMVGDITYIETWEGWVYLATVIDCYSKAVIGWSMDDHYKTSLIERAINMAAKNHTLSPGAIFHSDRGSNYTSQAFAKTLKKLNIRQSVGRTGICYDNAMAESFFAALKNERVNRTVYPTRKHAITDVARYIELRYNSKRLHSGLGYKTPNEVLDEYNKHQLAA